VSESNGEEVFVYTGLNGNDAAQDVVHVRVDSSVTSIPDRAFYERKKLAKVELCEGLMEIGEWSFGIVATIRLHIYEHPQLTQ
jgi:hypothetical protein